MARRKGETTDKHRRRDFPHEVELVPPPGGLRQRLNAMTAWCDANAKDGFATTSRLDRDLGRDYIQFRFRDEATADAFRKAFGLPMRTSDDVEVYEAAALMLKRYGKEAAQEADKRAKVHLTRNEHAGYVTWRFISGAIAQIQRSREPGEPVN